MDSDSGLSLLRQRRFGPFFLTQFLGAFNDNVFKNALLILLAYQGAGLAGGEALWTNLAAGLFILPFFLFSATAGQLADKYEKSALMRRIKAAEIAIMALGALGLWLNQPYLLILVLFCMGAQSAFFGPVKYGILPQHLRETELVAGNGLIEMGTFLAILLGTLTGGVMIALEAGAAWVAAAVVVFAALGYLASRGIPRAEAAEPALRIEWNPLRETWRNYRFTRRNRTVFLSILGISWFWFVGATYLTQLPVYSKTVLGGSEQVVTLLLTLFSLGIGVGSLLCDRMSGHKVELGLVPFGSIGLTVFGVDLYFAAAAPAQAELLGAAAFAAQPGGWRVMADILLLGLFAGFYIVPLYALVQARSEPSHRSRIIAGNNILNALFMVLSALFAIAMLSVLELGIPELFLLVALLNAAVAIYIYTLVPEFLMRFIVWMAIHTLYRVRKSGLERIPDQGPAVLVCNHVSFVDALVLAGSIRRPVRFVMYHKIFKLPLLSFVFRTARAIPIAPAKEDPALLERAYEEIAAALEQGELVCLFPEGQITATGEMNPFRSGVERIIARNPVPVIPMALQGLWGSFFSRRGGAAFAKLPRGPWSRIGLVVGAPLAPEAVTAADLQLRVADLRGAEA